MRLPNGKVVDILSDVFEEMLKWVQADIKCPESGGFIVGYKHSKTGNITLENISHPYPLDIKNRIYFKIIDPRHKHYLHKAEKRKSYYMGYGIHILSLFQNLLVLIGMIGMKH